MLLLSWGFFFLNCSWTQGPFFVFILLCRPSEESLQWGTIPDDSPSKDWQPTLGWEIARFEPGTAGLESCVATNEPPLLPKSHHCSLMSHHCLITILKPFGGQQHEWSYKASPPSSGFYLILFL
jgi:hypothetical protein